MDGGGGVSEVFFGRGGAESWNGFEDVIVQGGGEGRLGLGSSVRVV